MSLLFSKQLLHWHTNQNDRQLDWKNIKDPYKIWLSEILLQQTRADHVSKYFQSFVTKYPSIIHLANAKEQDVFRLWQGLGYYSRCRNLLTTARIIRDEYNGIFPNQYEQILALKGVGPYTASAIASFAFDLPFAVLDGNVYRILSRIFGIYTPIDSIEGKKQFTQLAQTLLIKKQAAVYNQAIMDFGATVCKPKLPLCSTCPMQSICVSYKDDLQTILPIKSKKIKIKTRYFHYVVYKHSNLIYIKERLNKDVWQNLHEFHLIETDSEHAPLWNKKSLMPYLSFSEKQQLTHQKIFGYFYILTVNDKETIDQSLNIHPVSIDDLNLYSFPKLLIDFIRNQTWQ